MTLKPSMEQWHCSSLTYQAVQDLARTPSLTVSGGTQWLCIRT